jgi:hypothetical protein
MIALGLSIFNSSFGLCGPAGVSLSTKFTFYMRFYFGLLCKGLLGLALALVCLAPARAQYIDVSEPVPFECPIVCAGGALTVKIFNLENLGNGAQLQAQLSNDQGSFASGIQTLPIAEYSTNNGTRGNVFWIDQGRACAA